MGTDISLHGSKEMKSMYKNAIIIISCALVALVGCAGLTKSGSAEGSDALEMVRDIRVPASHAGPLYTVYWSDKAIKATGPVNTGKKNGTWKLYFPGTEGRSLQAEVTFRYDVVDGKFKEYYPSGRLKVETDYRNGTRSGRHMLYYENGVGKLEEYYRDGVKNGKSFDYYENGYTRENAYFKEGVRDGMSSSFYENGKRKAVGRYAGGKKNGRWEFFSPEGILTSRGSYVNDRKSGVWTYYDESGKKEERSYN